MRGRKRMSAVAGVMALAVLACNCAPLTNAAGALEGLIRAPGAELTPGLPEGAPAYPMDDVTPTRVAT